MVTAPKGGQRLLGQHYHSPRASGFRAHSERFSAKLEQIHARNFLKEAVEHALLANLRPFVKHLPNFCLLKNP
jgi:hypothetical protein